MLARTGQEPETTRDTSQGLLLLDEEYLNLREAHLVGRYYTRQRQLHGDCFYMGLCEPRDAVERRIRETADYIEDAKVLANAS